MHWKATASSAVVWTIWHAGLLNYYLRGRGLHRVHSNLWSCTCTCSQPYFHSEDTHALTHVCTHARMHAHARTHAYIHMHTHTHIHTTYWQILVLSSAFLVSLLITNICQHLQVLWALKWPHYGHLKHLYTWMGCIPQAITSDTAQTCIIDVQTVAHCLYISVVLVWLQKFSFSYSFF